MKNKGLTIAVISLLVVGGGIAAYMLLKKKKKAGQDSEILEETSIEVIANKKFDKGENLTNEEAASLSDDRKKKLGKKVLTGAGIALGVGALALGINEVVKKRNAATGYVSKVKTADTTISSPAATIKTAYKPLAI